MSDKTKLYLIIGFGVLTLVLVLVAIIVHLSGGDATAVGGGAGLAAGGAIAAVASRVTTLNTVTETAEGLDAATGEMETGKAETDAAIAAVDGEVENMTRDEKEKEGEALFGGDE